jgi:hypothetical protein
VQVFLQTRGRTTDYGFLGQSPNKRWWLDFRPFTSFEKPTLLVTSNAKCWNAYLSGIPSGRFDRVNTPIRYSLVLEGAVAAEEDVGKAIKLIAAWVADVASPAVSTEVQVALDTAFPEEIVEGLLGDHSDKAFKEIEGQLRNAVSRLAGAEPIRLAKDRHEQNVTIPWVGGIQAPACREAFLDYVDTLLRGGDGAALMVNLVGNKEEASAMLENQPKAAVLLVDPAPSFQSKGIEPLQKKKLTELTEGGTEAVSLKTSQTCNILLKTVIILGAITLLAFGLHYSFKTDEERIELSPQTDQSAR